MRRPPVYRDRSRSDSKRRGLPPWPRPSRRGFPAPPGKPRHTIRCMRITEALAGPEPVFSFEFFPPKTPEGLEQLFGTVETLRALGPDYVSITYGAGGATRDGTVEIANRIK